MAAGVGKTYRMLQEGHAELEAGRDVVIGLLETHGRAETARRAPRACPVVPRRRVTYRGTDARGDGPPRRSCAAPRSCAWSTSWPTPTRPGVEHDKRYEDIEDLLDAGIDVLSTVNVQHLESLNDQVAELSGVTRARDRAGLGARPRRRGRPHRPQPRGAARAPARRARSTSPSASTPRSTASSASRTSPRCARSRCARSPRRSRPSGWSPRPSARARRRWPPTCPQAVGERLLALVEPVPGRAAARAPRVALGPAPRRRARPAVGRAARARAGRRAGAPARRAAPARPRCSGATLLVEPGDDVADTVARVARRARHHLHPAGPLAPGARARRACASRSPSASCRRCPASTSASSPTAPSAAREDPMIAAVAVAVVVVARSPAAPRRGWCLPPRRAAPRRARRPRGTRRILLPFTGTSISRRSLRRRRAPGARRGRDDHARLPGPRAAPPAARRAAARPVPAGDAAAGGDRAAREHRRASPVDARVVRGRTYRDALRRMLEPSPSTASSSRPPRTARTGLSAEDLEWLLEKVPAEVLILRPDPEDHRKVTAEAVAGPLLEADRAPRGSYVAVG